MIVFEIVKFGLAEFKLQIYFESDMPLKLMLPYAILCSH